VTWLDGSSRFVRVTRSPGEVLSVRPPGNSLTFDLPLSWACSGKSQMPSTVKGVLSTGSGGAAELARGSTTASATAKARVTPNTKTTSLPGKVVYMRCPFSSLLGHYQHWGVGS